jgi:putative membrane protein
MSVSDFLQPAAKEQVTRVIEGVEGQTAAELVVAVRKISGHYRHTDYLVGALGALAGLLVFLFHPAPFDEDLFPAAEVALFLAGAALSASVDPLRRALTSAKLRETNVKTAATAALHEMGITRTQGRTGVLVFVSLFERQVEVVTDIGVDAKQLDGAWGEALRALQEAVEGGDLAAFVGALSRLGAPLGKLLPRAHDDVNELSDEVR